MSIAARDLKFAIDDDLHSHWSPNFPEFSHLANAFMAALPYLEPYFIQNIREAAELLDDAALAADVQGFIEQEARHAQQHRSWNQLLAQRYPGFDRLERALKARLAKSRRKDSLAFRMAYTAGYEALTYQLVCFIVEQRQLWFDGADPRMLALLCWHAAEEVEHKSVAFDCFQKIHGGYALRVIGYVSAFRISVRDIQGMVRHLLAGDGLLGDPQSRKRLWAVRRVLLTKLVPQLWQYLMPDYHPSRHRDPPVLTAWLDRYRSGEDLRALDLDALERAA
jgi:predicted metal-dependent hydrolase